VEQNMLFICHSMKVALGANHFVEWDTWLVWAGFAPLVVMHWDDGLGGGNDC
jgi:hypothetical protein